MVSRRIPHTRGGESDDQRSIRRLSRVFPTRVGVNQIILGVLVVISRVSHGRAGIWSIWSNMQGVPVTDKDWQGVIRLVVFVLALALCSIPAALALGLAVWMFLWDSGA